MKKRNLILIGAVSLMLGIFVYLPASLLQAALFEPVFGMKTHEVSGNLLRGRAGLAYPVNAPQLTLSDIRWEFNPARLILFTVSHNIEAYTSNGHIKVTTGISPTGSIRLSNVRGEIPLDDVKSAGTLKFLPFDGRLFADLDEAILQGSGLKSVDGILQLQATRYTLMKPPLGLGSFELSLASSDQNITGELRDTEGPLQLEGTLNLKSNGLYQVYLRLRPKSSAKQGVRNILYPIGESDPEGWYTINHKGTLTND